MVETQPFRVGLLTGAEIHPDYPRINFLTAHKNSSTNMVFALGALVNASVPLSGKDFFFKFD